MDNILITGTKGFIGSNLKQHLQSDFNVIEVEEDIFDDVNWSNKLDNLFLEYKFKSVFHVGACSNTLEQDVNYIMLVNYQFTKHLTDLCKSHNVKLIYSSSAANYGINGVYPSNLYGWSKYTSEDYVISNGGVALRYFNVYGPGENNKGRMASVAYQMWNKNKNREKCFLFPKKPLRDFVYIKDIISANIWADKTYQNIQGQKFEVGSGNMRSFEDVLSLLNITWEYLPESSIPQGYQFLTCSDKSKWLPGWSSNWSLEQGISDYLLYLK